MLDEYGWYMGEEEAEEGPDDSMYCDDCGTGPCECHVIETMLIEMLAKHQ